MIQYYYDNHYPVVPCSVMQHEASLLFNDLNHIIPNIFKHVRNNEVIPILFKLGLHPPSENALSLMPIMSKKTTLYRGWLGVTLYHLVAQSILHMYVYSSMTYLDELSIEVNHYDLIFLLQYHYDLIFHGYTFSRKEIFVISTFLIHWPACFNINFKVAICKWKQCNIIKWTHSLLMDAHW